MARRHAGLAALSLSLGLSAVPALAWEQEDVLARLKTSLAEQTLEIEWQGVSGSGNDLVLEGVSAGIVNVGERVSIGSVTLSGIEDGEDDTVVIGSIALPTWEFTSPEGGVISVRSLEIAGQVLPGPATTDELNKLGLYDSFTVGGLEVTNKGAKILSASDLAVNLERDDAGVLHAEGGLDAFQIDFTTFPDEKAKAALAAFGHTIMSGGMSFESSWNPQTGQFTSDQIALTVDDAATLSLALDLSGYTLAFVKQAREFSARSNEAKTDEEKMAQGMMMIGMMQTLVLSSASIRIDDDGLTEKALAFFGQQQGVSATDAANQVKGMVPFMMAQLNNAELTQMVSTAVNTYIDNPQSLTLSATPAAPTPFAQLMAAGMGGDPTAIIAALGLKLVANE
ncbi:MAG: hypothetical protein WAT70_14905 [Rhizobiaceae bacterium]